MRNIRRAIITVSAALLIMLLGVQLPQPGSTLRCPTPTSPVYAVRDSATGATNLTLGPQASPDAAGSTQLGALFTAAPEAAPGLTGVHLLTRAGDHLYTAIASQVAAAIQAGYVDHGTQFWTSSQSSCGDEVRRFTLGGVSQYAMTPSDRALLSKAGWTEAGVAFRATPLSQYTWPAVTGKGPLDLAPYNSPDSLAWKAYKQATKRSDRESFYQLAATPTAIWLGPSDNIRSYVDKITTAAAAAHEAPLFVLYAIPDRDCSGYAAGGLPDANSYRRWVDGIRKGLDGRSAVVIVEPDAIGMSCLSADGAEQRTSLLRYALQTLSGPPHVWVYIHAGSAGLDPQAMATDLIKVGIASARGFAVNVSGFDSTASEIAYGKRINVALNASGVAGKHFVVDTSRSGAGRPQPGATGDVPRWCNPRGRAVGPRPTPLTGDEEVDALLWIKPPGESDGPCYPGDPATGWFDRYALDLVSAGLERRTIADLPVP